ncbi:MAG: hypothetical protein ACRC3H_00740 [Lachnospiraceae bacterium]
MIKKRKILSLVTAAVLCFSMSSAAFADDIDGQGAISPTSAAINVALPANFYWYADNTTFNSGTGFYDIVSGTYNITNNSVSPNLKVELTGYGANTAVGSSSFSTVSESDITLNLTGDLAQGTIGQDLFNATSPYGTYTATIGGINSMGTGATAGETWSFGFDGSYNQAALPGSADLADYTITLTFSIASFS